PEGVGGGEDRGGRLGKAQQALGAELAVLVGEVAVLDELRTDRDTGLSQHGVVSLDTLTGGDRVLSAAEHPDAAMAEVRVVLGRCAAATPVVGCAGGDACGIGVDSDGVARGLG